MQKGAYMENIEILLKFIMLKKALVMRCFGKYDLLIGNDEVESPILSSGTTKTVKQLF